MGDIYRAIVTCNQCPFCGRRSLTNIVYHQVVGALVLGEGRGLQPQSWPERPKGTPTVSENVHCFAASRAPCCVGTRPICQVAKEWGVVEGCFCSQLLTKLDVDAESKGWRHSAEGLPPLLSQTGQCRHSTSSVAVTNACCATPCHPSGHTQFLFSSFLLLRVAVVSKVSPSSSPPSLSAARSLALSLSLPRPLPPST